MGWKEDVDLLQEKVKEGQEKQEALNDAIATANMAQSEYTAVVSEIESLKTKLHDTIGTIFSPGNTKVRQF